ncbi:hypothetical protein ACLB2K_025405 [Fragaria x ananassa]
MRWRVQLRWLMRVDAVEVAMTARVDAHQRSVDGRVSDGWRWWIPVVAQLCRRFRNLGIGVGFRPRNE